MNKLLIILLAMVGFSSMNQAKEPTNDDENIITAPVKAYFKALNLSDQRSIMKLYGKDPVFMQQGAPAFVGRAAVDKAYVDIFNIIKLDVSFEVIEVEQLGLSTALVRTHSAGTAYFKEAKTSRNEASNELFILRKEGESWRIDYYIFSADHR